MNDCKTGIIVIDQFKLIIPILYYTTGPFFATPTVWVEYCNKAVNLTTALEGPGEGYGELAFMIEIPVHCHLRLSVLCLLLQYFELDSGRDTENTALNGQVSASHR